VTIKVIVIDPHKPPRLEDVEDTLQNWQELVGGYIELVPIRWSDAIGVVNEEGWVRSLSFNELATDCANVPIAGPMVIAGNAGSDFGNAPQSVIDALVDPTEGAS
jgi:hypothetical protein